MPINVDVGQTDQPPKGFSDALLALNGMQVAQKSGDTSAYNTHFKELELKMRENKIAMQRQYNQTIEKLQDQIKEANSKIGDKEVLANAQRDIQMAIQEKDWVKAMALASLHKDIDAGSLLKSLAMSPDFDQNMAAAIFDIDPTIQKSEHLRQLMKQKIAAGKRQASQTDKLKGNREGTPGGTMYRDRDLLPNNTRVLPEYEGGDSDISPFLPSETNRFEPSWGQIEDPESDDFNAEEYDMLIRTITGDKLEAHDAIIKTVDEMLSRGEIDDETGYLLKIKALSGTGSGIELNTKDTLIRYIDKKVADGQMTQEEGEKRKSAIMREIESAEAVDKTKVAAPIGTISGDVGKYIQQAYNVGITDETTPGAVNIPTWQYWEMYNLDMQEPPDKDGNRPFNRIKQLIRDDSFAGKPPKLKEIMYAQHTLYEKTFDLESKIRELNPEDFSKISRYRIELTRWLRSVVPEDYDPDSDMPDIDFGAIDDPKVFEYLTDVTMAIQNYRQLKSGAAFTESEAREYEAIFPNLYQSFEHAMASLRGMRGYTLGELQTHYSTVYGDEMGEWVYPEKESQFGDISNIYSREGGRDLSKSQAAVDKYAEIISGDSELMGKSVGTLVYELMKRYPGTPYRKAYKIIKSIKEGKKYNTNTNELEGAAPTENADDGAMLNGGRPNPQQADQIKQNIVDHYGYSEIPYNDFVEIVNAIKTRFRNMTDSEIERLVMV